MPVHHFNPPPRQPCPHRAVAAVWLALGMPLNWACVPMSFFSAMYYFGCGYDPLSVSVSFSAESTTLLSADIRLRPKAVRHFRSYLWYRPKVNFILSVDLYIGLQ